MCFVQNVCGFRCGVCVYAGFRLICKMNSIFDLLNLRNLNQIIYTPQHCRPTILLTEIVQITCKTAIHSDMQITIDLRLYQVKCFARKYFMDTWPWYVACVPCYVLHYCDLWTLLLYIFYQKKHDYDEGKRLSQLKFITLAHREHRRRSTQTTGTGVFIFFTV